MAKVSIVDMIVKKLKRVVAIVEDGDTASQAIAKGKFVIWKGNACQASSAISQGDTLSSSNLTALSHGIGNELNSKISNFPISTGAVTVVKALSTSGQNVSYTVQTDGWYSIQVTTGSTTGSSFARITIGNTIIMQISANLGQYDTLFPAPMLLKAGTEIKGMAGFPANGAANIVKIQ